MKKIAGLFCVSMMILFLSGCSKENKSPYEQISGRWTISSGTSVTGNPPYSPFSGFGLFAPSSSDVILHEDQTFTPLQRQTSSTTVFIPLDKGSYDYNPEVKKLFFKLGIIEFEYKVTYFKDDELELEWESHVYKFKRD